MITLVDLPTDVLYTIFPYLDPADFLVLTSCTKTLHNYRQDPNYWRILTRTTFRIPPQPLLQADGARWQWLYRRLRTQTQLYTWGSNGCGNLGHGFLNVPRDSAGQHNWADINTRNIGWPRKVQLDDMPEPIGIVADVQCGLVQIYANTRNVGLMSDFLAEDGLLRCSTQLEFCTCVEE
ncbi:MAG: hypothetical protein Q9192_003663 [Flavoplaca navasiana]